MGIYNKLKIELEIKIILNKPNSICLLRLLKPLPAKNKVKVF